MKLFVFIFSFIFVQAQSFNAQTLDVQGVLSDSITKSVLPYGYIVAKNAKDSLLAGVLADERGVFLLKKISKQQMAYLQINYVGYKTKNIGLSSNNSSKIELGTLELTPDLYKLKETTVVGTIKYMERKFDRQVYNMSDNRISSARTVLDLLRTLPGVVVDEEGNIRYKGAQATIYVDDQPSSFLYPNVEMIPVAMIKKVELIDIAMYNGSTGTGGIINLKMKSITNEGISGIFSSDANTIFLNRLDLYKGFLNLNYKIKNITIFNNFSESNQHQNTDRDTEGFLNYEYPYKTTNISNQITNRNGFFNYTGIKISLKEKTRIIIGEGFYCDNRKQFSGTTNQQTFLSSNSFFDSYSTTEKYIISSKGISFGIWGAHDFMNGQAIRGGVNFEHSIAPGNLETNYSYKYINSLPIDSTSQIAYDKKERRNNLIFNLIYIHPINTSIQWNIGINSVNRLQQTNNNKAYVNTMANLPLTTYTTGRTQNHELFWKIGSVFHKWKFNGGVSLQYNRIFANYTRFQISNKDTLLHVHKEFLNILPSVTISFALDSIQAIKLTYAQSINAPDYFYLCNFVDKSNPRSWRTGNSLLDPVRLQNLYLGYTFSKEKWNLSAETFFSLTDNEIYTVSYPYSSTVWLNIPDNLAKRSSIGIDFSSWLMLNKSMDFSLSSSLLHTFIDASSLNNRFQELGLNKMDLKKKSFGFNVKCSMNLRFNPTTSGMLYINYFSREITFEGYNYGYINSSASLTKKFANNKLFLTIGIHNLLDDLVIHGGYINYAGLTATAKQESSNYRRNYFISLQYKIKQGDRGTRDYKAGR
ncbi:MAG: TonB-dependent receptor [Bacteroidota bacterium]|nr:TonB-dependent receptor [Bacteroidota bacterium]